MLLTFTLAAASMAPFATPAPLLSVPGLAPGLDPGSHLACLPTGGEGDKKTDVIGESVRIVTRDKIALVASYFAPRAKRGTKSPGALLIHDAGSDRSALIGMALYLQKKGFGVLALDLRAHGDSASEGLDWGEMQRGAQESAWAFSGRDLEAAASYLLGRPDIHSANLSLIGIGAGGALVLRHAIDDGAARAVVLVSPPENALGFDVNGSICDLGGLPCLIVAPKEGRTLAEKMQASGHNANDGYEYVTVQVMKTTGDELLEDKRLNSSFSKWLTGEVMERDQRP